MDLEDFIRRVLLDNALKYGGKAEPKAALGAVMREFPDRRAEAKHIIDTAEAIAAEVNSMTADEQQAALDAIGGSGAPERQERDPFHIEEANPVLRFEPSPSGPLHIGHTYPLGLNHLLAERNDGKLILRIADTNPENIYPEAYDLIPRDTDWYTHDNIAEVHVQSDRMPLYYSYAERMLANGWAYVCVCDPEEFRERINRKEACPCRQIPPAEQLVRWEGMLSDAEEGSAVVRVKTDVEHKNPAMRDWPALRINTAEHPRQGTKYRVWPLMNFSVSVDDMEMGMTHVLRAKDHADNAKRQEFVYRYFDYPIPKTYFVGRVNFTDLRLSTSETRKRIDAGDFTGWDDIRLPFLPALRRRGFQPESFLRLAEEMGISASDKKVSTKEYFTNIEAFNRELIEPVADRAFFVPDPQLIRIKDAPTVTVEKDLHPDERPGGRRLTAGDELFVSKRDLQETNGVLLRLIDAFNFRVDAGTFLYAGDSYEDYRKAEKRRIIQYVSPADDPVEVRVHMPDGSWAEGLAERRVLDYDEGTLLQFERFGFVRLDSKEKGEFWFTHG